MSRHRIGILQQNSKRKNQSIIYQINPKESPPPHPALGCSGGKKESEDP